MVHESRIFEAGHLYRLESSHGAGSQPLDCLSRRALLDHEKFRPVFEAAAQLQVPLYIHGADSRGRFGGSNGARAFVETAPIGAQDKAKLAYLNAERLPLRRTA